MNKSIVLLLICIFLLCGCKRKTQSDTIYSQYLHFASEKKNQNLTQLDSIAFYNNKYIAYFRYDTFNLLQKIEGFLLGKKFGHSFRMDVFDKLPPKKFSESLIEYKFEIGDNLRSNYEIRYNFQESKYYEKGSPFVDYISGVSDSINKYTLLFSTFPRKDLEISYSLDGKEFIDLISQKSTIMPFLNEATILIREDQICIIKITARNLLFDLNSIKNEKLFYDTVLFK